MKKFIRIAANLILCACPLWLSAQEHALITKRLVQKNQCAGGKFFIGFDVIRTLPLGKFDKANGASGEGSAKIGQGGALKMGMNLNRHWRVGLTAFQQTVFGADASFILGLHVQGIPQNMNWEFRQAENWNANQINLGIARIFRPLGKRVTITAGASAGVLELTSPAAKLMGESELYTSPPFWFIIWFGGSTTIHYHKQLLLTSARSNPLVVGLNSDISIRLLKHFTLQAGADLSYAKAKFRNVHFTYYNDRLNEPQPGFESRLNFSQQYLSSNFKIGLNYTFNF